MPSADKFKKTISNIENEDVKNRILQDFNDISDLSKKVLKGSYLIKR